VETLYDDVSHVTKDGLHKLVSAEAAAVQRVS